MTAEFRQRIREILETTEEELLRTIREYREEYRDLSSTDCVEVGDQASIAESLNDVGSVMRHYELRLSRIQAARMRFDNGHYGRCHQCGEPIPQDRLIARPDALFCLDCTRQRERLKARHGSVA